MYCMLSIAGVQAEQVTKYNNAVILISNTISLDRQILTIPVSTEVPYQNLLIKVNSCFRLISSGQDLVGNLEIARNKSGKNTIYKNYILYNQRPNLNSEMENSYFEIRLLDCHNRDEIILNKVN